jgi:hypothetical protein
MFGLVLNIAKFSATEEKHNSNILFVERYWLTVPLKITILIKLVINFPDNNIYKISDINSTSIDDDARRDRPPRSMLRYINKPWLAWKLLFSNFF